MVDISLNKNNIQKNLKKTTIAVKQQETKAQEAVKTASASASQKATPAKVISDITKGAPIAKAVETIKNDLKTEVKTTKENKLTKISTRVKNIKVKITTNSKDVVADKATTTDKSEISRPTKKPTGIGTAKPPVTTGKDGKTGPTSKPIGNSSISTTGKSGKTDSTNTPVVTVKPTVTTGKGGKIGPTIKPTGGGKGDRIINPNILVDLNNVYTAKDLAKYNVPNEFITQFFDKVGNRFVLKEGVTFEQFEVSVQMYGTVVGNNDLATRLQDEATFNAIIDKLLESNKPFNLDSLVDAVVSELNLTNLSPVDVTVLTTMLTSLVSAYTGKTDAEDIAKFLETNDKTFAQIYNEAVEADNSSKPGGAVRRVGRKDGESAQHYGAYLAMQGFATALGCMGGAAGIAGSLLSTTVDVCRLVDLYHWGKMGKDEFIMSLAETLMLGAMDLMLSTLPGGKAASKLAKPLLEKIVSKAVDKLIQSAIFDGVNDSFLGNNGTTSGKGGTSGGSGTGGSNWGDYGTGNTGNSYNGGTWVNPSVVDTWSQGYNHYDGYTVNTGNGNSVEFGDWTAIGTSEDNKGGFDGVYTDNNGNPVVVTGSNGNGKSADSGAVTVKSERTNSDGSKTIEFSDGSSYTTAKDGTVTWNYPDGSKIVQHNDGSYEKYDSNGNVINRDNYGNSQATTYNPSTGVTTTVTYTTNDGTSNGNPATITTTTDKNGNTTVSVTTTDSNGNTVTIWQDENGKTHMEYPNGNSSSSSNNQDIYDWFDQISGISSDGFLSGKGHSGFSGDDLSGRCRGGGNVGISAARNIDDSEERNAMENLKHWRDSMFNK